MGSKGISPNIDRARDPWTSRTTVLPQPVLARRRSGLDRVAWASLYAFVFSIPWEDAFPVLGGLEISRWLGLLSFGLTFIRMLRMGRLRKLSSLHSWMLVFAAWSAFSIVWSIAPKNTAERAGTYVQLIGMAWAIWELAADYPRVRRLTQAYVLGSIVSSVMTTQSAISNRYNSLYRYTAGGFNQNDLGILLALSIPMSLYLISRDKGRIRYLYWIQLPLCITALLLTGSRAAVLTLGVGLIGSLFLVASWPGRQRIFIAIAAVIMAAVLAYAVPGPTWERVFSIGEEVVDGDMTHRTTIWAGGMEVFRNHPFVGVGSGAFAPAVANLIDNWYVAHNTFISVLVELGIVGELILATWLAAMLFCAMRLPRLDRCLWLTLILAWAVGVSSGTWEYHKATWFLFGALAAWVSAAHKEWLIRRPDGL